jgi:hypothetical protein
VTEPTISSEPTIDGEDLPDTDAEQSEVEAELAESFARPPIGAVKPIRDPDDEPYVFRFEVGPAILIQLLEKLRRLEVRPLIESLNAKHPGFYQLFVKEEPRYIGKTSRPIGSRLAEHAKKIRGRENLNLTDVGCKYAYVEDPSLVDVAEGALINFFGAHGAAEWNRSGFGSKVTGYNRGKQSGSDWDTLYPPNLAFAIEAGFKQPILLQSIITQIARSAPLTLSIPKTHRAAFRADHTQKVAIEIAKRPFNEWISIIKDHLAPGWHVDQQAGGWYFVKDVPS